MTESHKIAIACCGLGHVKRGIEVWAAELARLLRAKGMDITLFKGGGMSEAEGEQVVPCIKRGSRIAKLLTSVPFRGKCRTPFSSPYNLESFTFALNVRRRLKGIAVIHLQDATLGLCLSKRNRTAWSYDVLYADGTEQPVPVRMEFDVNQELDEYGRDELIGAGCAKPIYVLPNFVDSLKFCPGNKKVLRPKYGIREDAFVVLTVGAVGKRFKRMDYFIREFARATSPNAIALIVGAETDRTEELRLLGERLLGDRCRFITDLDHSLMPEVYQLSDVFVFCVTHGIFGIATAEAAATGLPCILHDWKRVSWVGGPEAEIIDMKKVGELTQAVEKMAHSNERAERGRKTRDWVLKTLSADVVIDRYIRMYEEILRGRISPVLPAAKAIFRTANPPVS